MATKKYLSLDRLTEYDALIKIEIDERINVAKNDLLNGAGEAYDTLKELGDLIDENHDAIDALETVATGKADAEHTHDGLYYTEAEINAVLDPIRRDISGMASEDHTHGAQDISYVTLIDMKESNVGEALSVIEATLTNKSDVGHNHDASDITSGALSTDRLPIIPIEKGGTGGTNVAEALTNLGLDESIMIKSIEAKLPLSDTWVKSCYGGGKFIAVATGSDTSLYSENGVEWHEATLPNSATWRGVAYGNGVYVAIAYGSGTSAYSTDGITWNSAIMPSSASWYDVAYGNGMFVATSAGQDAAYSYDGVTWNHMLLPVSLGYSITCGNGRFVVVCTGSKNGAYSDDGINWNIMQMPSSADWYDVTYGNGKFVAIREGSTYAAYSTDGINWEQTTLPSSLNWNGVCYNNSNNIFVAVANDSDVAAYSTDGISWLRTSMPMVGNWATVSYGNGRLVALEFVGKDVALSNDGINWSIYAKVVQDANGTDVTNEVKEALGVVEQNTSNLVDLTSVQTVSGVKTFSNGIKIGDATMSYDTTQKAIVFIFE